MEIQHLGFTCNNLRSLYKIFVWTRVEAGWRAYAGLPVKCESVDLGGSVYTSL